MNIRLRLVAFLALAPALACGKRGDPRPPLRRTPQPLTAFRLAQRADRLEISGVAPRFSTEGVALKPLTVEVLRADGEGDFLKLAKKRSFVVQPGEAFTEPDPLPAAGTLVRVAARALASGKTSTMTSIASLPVQAPPDPPHDLAATLSEGGVQLRWSGKRPSPLPTPSAAPADAAPAPSLDTTPPANGTPTPPAPLAAPPPSTPQPASPAGALPAAPAEPPAPKSGFWVYRRAQTGRYDRPLFPEPTQDKSQVDGEAAVGQSWCYVVRAVASHDPLIESASSNEACLTARDIAPPAVPVGLTLLVQPGGLELRWSPSPDPDLAFYRVYRATSSGAAEKLTETPAGTSVFVDHTVTPGTAYRYTITAVDQVGNESAPSRPLLGNLP
jgi:hypothetical protein